jgi:hypothetical protein
MKKKQTIVAAVFCLLHFQFTSCAGRLLMPVHIYKVPLYVLFEVRIQNPATNELAILSVTYKYLLFLRRFIILYSLTQSLFNGKLIV